MGRASRILILAASVLALGGCAVARGIIAESLGVPVASKAVAEKRGRTELMATDGTWCHVSRGTFEKTEVGDHVLCTWSKEPRQGSPEPRPPIRGQRDGSPGGRQS